MDIDYTPFVFVGIVSIGLMLTLVTYVLREWVIEYSEFGRKLSFRRVFGFWPGEEPVDWDTLGQKVIDSQLSILAKEFLDACEEQQKFRAEFQKLDLYGLSGEEIKRARREVGQKLRRVDREVERTKRGFWRHHKLASEFEYFVRRGVRDYMRLIS